MEVKTKDQILNDLRSLVYNYNEKIKTIDEIKQLQEIRVEALGKKSPLTEILKGIKDLDNEAKKLVGNEANTTKKGIAELLANREIELLNNKFKNIDKTEKIDVTLPGKTTKRGHKHPITQMTELCEDIFQTMGFDIYYPYAIDDDFHNFTSLNLPENHPARDSWDTFWTEDGHIAITHTSSMQNRILASGNIPIRAIVPGRCFRNEATDARHEHTFTQLEGIYVDKGITLNDLLGTLKEFFTKFYEQEIEVKFTPDFFPFVEPGGMMSLSCVLCKGKGCAVCKNSGWLEVMGCGMIHPKVLEMAGIDSTTYSGFAWGFGIERLVMLKYNIDDIRYFNSGNLDFIRQF